MYLFTRTSTVHENRVAEGLAFAAEAASKVKAITGVTVNVYNAQFGLPLGTVIWSSRYENHSELADVQAKLSIDPGYLELVKQGGSLFGKVTDSLNSVLSSSGLTSPKPIYVVTEAVIANGKAAKATAFGVKAQEYVASKTGLATAFVAGVYGRFGGVGWLVGADTMADVDKLHDWEATDKGFRDMIDQAGTDGLFVEGSGRNGLIEKIN